MEIRRYLHVSLRRWWAVLLAFVVTVSATAWIVLPEPVVYRSTASFVVRPHDLTGGDQIRAFDTLIRGVSINSTYASIARSRLIRDNARESLGPDFDATGLRVSAEVVTGTNILNISVRGPTPEAVQQFADAIARQTVAYVDRVDEAYRLEPLDAAALPRTPVATRTNLTLALGGVLGLVLGVWLAMLVEYLRTSAPAEVATSTAGAHAPTDGEPQPEPSALPISFLPPPDGWNGTPRAEVVESTNGDHARKRARLLTVERMASRSTRRSSERAREDR